ncbi:serine/threonine-protein kinase TBK1-like [Actinia tenebrosa]|uniref:Serine/threonine-protein kinase TBK1-like n=1 Tax=Actinia tenebrosa TaxID=6105 RepID=A0A6P8IIH9_ACTTE|nr:serine/threonine-protein kinase TBK1-like [Actinia tenebrosa]
MEIRSSTNYLWNIKDVLGQGATGAVYKGRNKKNGEEVAIKTTNHIGMMRPVEVRMREFEVLSKLDHRNIVRIFASEKELRSQSEIIVMELCNGGSLYNLLEHPSNAYGFSEKDCIDIIRDVVAGMEHLREQGIVHRDLKPGNIMRVFKEDNTCVYKLTDFGAARELMHSDQFISIYGTEEYLHPDLYERGVLRKHSSKTFGANVDLWSIGVTFYHIATGQLPFRPHGGRQNKDTMYHITTTKKSGMISGVQKQEGGPITWSDKLPEHTQLSCGFQELLTPILAGVLESVPANMMTFPDFFSKVQDIVSRTVIEVYYVQSGSFHQIHAKANEKFANFQERVARETGVQAPLQMFYVNGEPFNPNPNQEASKYPSTKRERPLILSGGYFVTPDLLRMRKIPPVAAIPDQRTLEEDSTVAKIIANCAFSCQISVKVYEDTMKAMASSLDCAIKSQRLKMLKMSADCCKTEERRFTVQNMTKNFCKSNEALVRMIEELSSHFQLPEEERADTEKEINMIRTWIQAKTTSDEELTKVNQYLEKLRSIITEMVDKECLSPLYFDFREKTSNITCYAVVSNLTSKIENIYMRFRKDKHQRRLSAAEEHNHQYDKKALSGLIERVKQVTKDCFQLQVQFHGELQNLLTQVHFKQDEAKRQQQYLEEAKEADKVHLYSLESTQKECLEMYQRIYKRIMQTRASSSLLSIGTDVPSLLSSNGITEQETLTEQYFLEMDDQIKSLCETTEKSRKSAKENTDQLKKLKSSFADFFKLLDESGLDTVKKLRELQAHQVLKDMESTEGVISQG